MKPSLYTINNDSGNGIIVVMEKDISNLNAYDRQREIVKFHKTEIKTFQSFVEETTLTILNNLGIFIYDDTKSSLESAFDTLKRKLRKNLIIEDRYKDTKEKILYKGVGFTVIQEDNIISVANEILLKEIEQ
jgi:uncharacterized protein YllA (UPF0747 family)